MSSVYRRRDIRTAYGYPTIKNFEVKSNEKSCRLILWTKINSKTSTCFAKILDNEIVGIVNNQIIIPNAYNSYDKNESREVVQQVSNIIGKRRNCLTLGDWNHTLSSIKNRLMK